MILDHPGVTTGVLIREVCESESEKDVRTEAESERSEDAAPLASKMKERATRQGTWAASRI